LSDEVSDTAHSFTVTLAGFDSDSLYEITNPER
jgi:hypothetical protein